jgi:hypothetical protein
MKKNQKFGIVFIVLAFVVLIFGGDIIREMVGYRAKRAFYDSFLNYIIPLVFIAIGIIFFLKKSITGLNNIDDSDSKSSILENDKFSIAGTHLIKCAYKFIGAIALQIIGMYVTMKMTINANTQNSIESAQRFGLIVSIIVFAIGIAAILDIKKAGESLNK